MDETSGAADNDLAETASATLGREIDYTLGENAEQVLAEIDAALARIDDGTYGTCSELRQADLRTSGSRRTLGDALHRLHQRRAEGG